MPTSLGRALAQWPRPMAASAHDPNQFKYEPRLQQSCWREVTTSLNCQSPCLNCRALPCSDREPAVDESTGWAGSHGLGTSRYVKHLPCHHSRPAVRGEPLAKRTQVPNPGCTRQRCGSPPRDDPIPHPLRLSQVGPDQGGATAKTRPTRSFVECHHPRHAA